MGSISLLELVDHYGVDGVVIVGNYMMNLIENSKPTITSLSLEHIYLTSLTGSIYEDSKKRFQNGSRIRTSSIIDKQKVNDGYIVKTLNSKYLVMVD